MAVSERDNVDKDSCAVNGNGEVVFGKGRFVEESFTFSSPNLFILSIVGKQKRTI